MKVTDCLIPAVLTVAACWAGFKACSCPTSSARPVDNSGRTSIVVEYPGIGWAELRGPARWHVLDLCTGDPIPAASNGSIKGPNHAGCIMNPYCAAGAGCNK